jgi:CheY-like chemotaxis protein
MAHKLLLADDSITIQRVIELTFAEEDVQVLAVGDGKHAIDRIRAERPDIVLADVGMPEQDGYEVAAFIKSQPQFAHIPVLLLTGAFEPIDEGRARAVGCDGVLVKPFEPQMVINRVKDLLAGRRAGTPGNSNAAQAAGPPEAPGHDPAPAPEAAAAGGQKLGDSLEDYFDRLDAAFANMGAEPVQVPTPAAAPPAAPKPIPVRSQPATVEDFASWDPDLAGDASRPASHAPAAAPAAAVAPAPAVSPALPPAPPLSVAPPAAPVAPPAAPVAPPVVAPPPAVQQSHRAAVPAPPQVSLAEAFASLLAAEHGQSITPAPTHRGAESGLIESPTPAVAPPPAIDDIVQRVLDRLQDQDMRRTVVDVAERLVREEIDRIKRANG